VAAVAALVVLAGTTIRAEPLWLQVLAGMEVLEFNPTSMEPQCFTAAAAVVIPNMLRVVYEREALGVQVEVVMAFNNHTSMLMRLFLLLMAQSILVGAGAEAEVDLLSLR
jgi:predicted neutral ceramidase superfamily lipid hydrolase